jgi:hypothetical protein
MHNACSPLTSWGRALTLTSAVCGNGVFFPLIVSDGRIIGTWKRTLKATRATLSLAFFTKPSAAVVRQYRVAAERDGVGDVFGAALDNVGVAVDPEHAVAALGQLAGHTAPEAAHPDHGEFVVVVVARHCPRSVATFRRDLVVYLDE